MAYNKDIPEATDTLTDSQSDLKANFQAIKALIDINHNTFGDPNEGKHFKVSLPVQSPAPTFSAGDVGIYSFLNPTTNQNELYINKLNQVTVTQIPATASTLSLTSAPVQSSAGFTYLPSGIYLTWGSGTANGSTTVTLPTPPPNQILAVMVTPVTGSTSYVNIQVPLESIVNNSTFKVFGAINGAASNANYSFLVIGY